MRGSVRRLMPASGPAYELFDAAVFLLILAVVGYVLTEPPPVTDRALSAPLEYAGQVTWGLTLAAVATFSIVCSYVPGWLRAGYVAMVVGCSFWAICFMTGMLFFGASTRAIISVVLYLWITRRLVREGWHR